MDIDIGRENAVEVYRALVGVVAPRPIAWVTTLNHAGTVNLAPFSFFNVFGANPPIVVFSPTLKRDGSKKDTLRNLERTREFVVNVVTEENVDAANGSSRDFPPDESELAALGLKTLASTRIRTPGVAGSPVALECLVDRILSYGTGPLSANLVVGEIIHIRIDDHVIGPDGRPDSALLRLVGRMGGDDFCKTADLFKLTRP